MTYSSYARQFIRADSVANYNENSSDPTSAPVSGVQISLLDFTQDPPLNSYWNKANLSDPGTCQTGPVSGFFIANATFLRDVNAVYAGEESTVNGVLTKWSCIVPGNTPVILTYFFDSYGHWVRFDFWSTGYQTGVQTYFYNMQVYANPLPLGIFAGSGCK